jgi:hypothetical protein
MKQGKAIIVLGKLLINDKSKLGKLIKYGEL